MQLDFVVSNVENLITSPLTANEYPVTAWTEISNSWLKEEIHEDIGEPIFDEEVDEECSEDFVYGNIGEALVIHKSLLMPKQEIKEDWLRRNIFHTTCTIGGKVCKLIIDGGSC